MIYQPQNFDRLLGTPGFSDQLLQNHFTLYQGYVKNTNALLELLDSKEPGTLEYAELSRRLGWEWNGMRLHELYFGNMVKNGSEGTPEFGPHADWVKDFKATGAMRGVGWVVLYWDAGAKRLFSAWINEHDVGHFAGCTPLLVMDVFEHAFMLDYGLKRADYIESFFAAIDWQVVEQRFAAVK